MKKKKINEVSISQQDNSLLVEIKIASKLIGRILLFALTLIFILLILFTGVSSGPEANVLGLIFSLIIMGLIASFFARWFLWNSFGVERITITDHIIRIQHDFRLFKNPPIEFSFNELKINFRQTDTHMNYDLQTLDASEIASITGSGYLQFTSENESYESDVRIAAADGMRIREAIYAA